MTAGGVAAFAAAYSLGLSGGLWAAITAIIVIQSNVGGSLKAAFEQLIGSIFGAAYAVAIALAIPPDDPLSRAIVLAIALAPTSILAAFSAGFRIAPITAAIVLLGGAGLGMGPVGFAAGRILEVGVGCGIGLLVSVLVVPARASRSVAGMASQTADLMARQLQALASGEAARQADIGSLAVRIRENLIRLATLVDEAARERRTRLTEVPDPRPLLRTMRRLRHDIDMLRRAAREAGTDVLHEHVAQSWFRAAESGAAALRGAGQLLAGERAPEDFDALSDAVRAYRGGLDEMRRAGLTRSLSTAALGRLFGIAFALDQLRRDLDELVDLSREIAGARSR